MIRMRHFRTLFSMLMLLALASCQPEPIHIKMVCTSDVHAAYFPYDYRNDEPMSGSLARVSSYLNELRSSSAYGDNVIYVDNGDILHGGPAAYYYNTVAIQPPHVAAEVLNYMGCEAAVLGNHEIETGGPTYQRYIRDLNCPVLGGNIYLEESNIAFLPPYTMVERAGVKIALMGLTTPAVPNWLPRTLWQGLEFRDMESEARYWMEYLQEKESPDLVIGLFHSGLEGGIVTDTYVENATRAIAENVVGFDAIFCGHVHQAACEKVINVEGDTVLIVNPSNKADKVATLDVLYVKGDEAQITLSAQLVDMNEYEPDEAYMAHFASHSEKIKEYVGKKIGTLEHGVDSREAYFGSSAFVDFLHRMQLDITSAEVSFAAPLEYNLSMPEGDVFVRDMFSLYRYENMLYVMMLTGQEIKDYLEMSYSRWVNTMKSANDHLLLFDEDKKTSLKNAYYNFDSAAGIIYEVDVTKPVGQKVNIKGMADGKPFDLERSYRVALNSYRGNGGGDLLTLGAGISKDKLESRLLTSTDIDLRFYMLNYIEMRKTVEPKALNHWKFVPERWTVPAAERDYRLLFGDKSN